MPPPIEFETCRPQSVPTRIQMCNKMSKKRKGRKHYYLTYSEKLILVLRWQYSKQLIHRIFTWFETFLIISVLGTNLERAREKKTFISRISELWSAKYTKKEPNLKIHCQCQLSIKQLLYVVQRFKSIFIYPKPEETLELF